MAPFLDSTGRGHRFLDQHESESESEKKGWRRRRRGVERGRARAQVKESVRARACVCMRVILRPGTCCPFSDGTRKPGMRPRFTRATTLNYDSRPSAQIRTCRPRVQFATRGQGGVNIACLIECARARLRSEALVHTEYILPPTPWILGLPGTSGYELRLRVTILNNMHILPWNPLNLGLPGTSGYKLDALL